MWTLSLLDADQRVLLHDACLHGPKNTPELAAAMARLAASPGWHAGALARLVDPGSDRFTAGATMTELERIQTWVQARGKEFAALPQGASASSRRAELRHPDDPDGGWSGLGPSCRELRHGELMGEFLAGVEADASPEVLPFDADFLECLGVAGERLRGTRVLTIRADGLASLTAIIGTRTYTHVRTFTRADAMKIGAHRFLALVVPEAAPVTLVGVHENLELPLHWHGIISRNEAVWVEPVHMSCLELSYVAGDDTRLYVDGIAIEARGVETRLPGARRHERTLTVALDQTRARVPDHEVVAIKRRRVGASEVGRDAWEIRHRESLPAAAAPAHMRRAHECTVLSLDFSEPPKRRVAVLGVTQGASCASSPMWADDLRERVRRIIETDRAHRDARQYANFSAYATAADALAALKTRMNPGEGRTTGAETGADAMELVGTAAKEAWRQGIDTLLSFELQCSPQGGGDGSSEPVDARAAASRWSYSLKATKIDVRTLFARGYHGRESLDLERFIHVDSIGFDSPRVRDPILVTLLDRVFDVVGELRFIFEQREVSYRTPITIRAGMVIDPSSPPPQLDPDDVLSQRREGLRLSVVSSSEFGPFDRVFCQPREDTRAELPESSSKLWLGRSARPSDSSASPNAAVYEGVFKAPRPGWYLLVLDSDGDGANGWPRRNWICVHATAEPREVWGDLAISGGPFMGAFNDALGDTGTAARFYLRGRVGATWYPRRARWFGAGLHGGFSLTDYQGTRSDWSDLGGTGSGTGTEADELRLWRRFSLLAGPMLEFRTRATRPELEFRARLAPAFNVGVVDLSRIPETAGQFRRGNTGNGVLDPDLDLFLDLAVTGITGAVEVGGTIMIGYTGVEDRLRLTGTTAFQDANLFIGIGLLLGGAR
ncbi:MAG: hypothetical protein KC468_05785 [Myxococcales bacterium]|nr:hypothetical protein [Myxococcales bacterium]